MPRAATATGLNSRKRKETRRRRGAVASREECMKSASSFNALLEEGRSRRKRGCINLQTYQLEQPCTERSDVVERIRFIERHSLRPIATMLYPPTFHSALMKRPSQTTSQMSSGQTNLRALSAITEQTESVNQTPTRLDERLRCGICDELVGSMPNRLRPPSSVVLTCSSCVRPHHVGCLQMHQTMARQVKKYKWQCVNCKTCTVCTRSSDAQSLMMCDRCDRGFHSFCVGIISVPDGKWTCEDCGCVGAFKTKTKRNGTVLLENEPVVDANGDNKRRR
ncbi:hypothetical protein ACOME3_000078 [Neoechinorhynchus agilis]